MWDLECQALKKPGGGAGSWGRGREGQNKQGLPQHRKGLPMGAEGSCGLKSSTHLAILFLTVTHTPAPGIHSHLPLMKLPPGAQALGQTHAQHPILVSAQQSQRPVLWGPLR